MNLDEVQGIFAEDNAELKSLLEKYSVDSVERCARWAFAFSQAWALVVFLRNKLFSVWECFWSLDRVRAPPKINWIQLCILIIGVFIGVAGFIATITLCCLYSKWVFETNSRERHYECLAGIRDGSDEATSRSWRLQWGRLSLPHCHQVLTSFRPIEFKFVRFFPSLIRLITFIMVQGQ